MPPKSQATAKIREEVVHVNGRDYPRFIADLGTVAGKRIRVTGSTVEEVEEKLGQRVKTQGRLQQRIGRQACRLSDANLLDAARAFDILKGSSSLARAARFFIQHHGGPTGGKTCDDLVREYVLSREKAGRRPATIRDIQVTLRPFLKAHGETPLAHITVHDLEKWMDAQNGGAVTRDKRRRHLFAIFHFAVRRRYRADNPAAALEIPNITKSKPHVLSPDDAEKFMRYVEKNEPALIPCFALALFAGIRPGGELRRLDWKDVDLSRGEVYLAEAVSKTGDERFVKMSDNLLAWLAPHKRKTGLIDYTRKAVVRCMEKGGVRWESDCLRHTFGTMHLAMYDDAAKTALQMGHRSLSMLFEHYRRAVRKEDAERFWKIRPENHNAEVVPFPAAGCLYDLRGASGRHMRL